VAADAAEALRGPATIRIVLADDDRSLRLLLRLTLQQDERLEVVGEAADGAEALELVESHDPDLLLLDLSMPRMDGLEVLSVLRGRDRPVVAVLTGFDDHHLEEQVRTSGAAMFLTKGAAFGDLGTTLLALLS
jgi:DNA-binding NarL/FixJ family response regulator